MFLITATGNLGSDPKIAETPFRHYKFSVAAKAGWGDRAQTVWLKIKADERRFASATVTMVKGSRVSLVARVTGVSEDGRSFFLDLVDITLQTKADKQGLTVASADDEMPF